MSTVITKRPAKKKPRRVTTRINIRVDRQLKSMLVKAAQLRKMKLSQFMLRSSQTAAEIELAERTRFLLPPEKWQEFNEALDAGPRDLPGLRKLFMESSVFETKPA